jgi:hypothetical protein|tara:strand:- start:1213 stop:1665 length:453 start_codon:yes stop_codon:yes gene_type:complete
MATNIGGIMTKSETHREKAEYIQYIGCSCYKHEKAISLGITNRDIGDREGERAFVSLVGFGLPLGTSKLKEARAFEKRVFDNLLEQPFIARAIVQHQGQRGKDWLKIHEIFKGKTSYQYFIQYIVSYVREQAELFKANPSGFLKGVNNGK